VLFVLPDSFTPPNSLTFPVSSSYDYRHHSIHDTKYKHMTSNQRIYICIISIIATFCETLTHGVEILLQSKYSTSSSAIAGWVSYGQKWKTGTG